MQEGTLAKEVEKLLLVRSGTFRDWNSPTLGQFTTSSGCLGQEVEKYLSQNEQRIGSGSLNSDLTLGR